MTAASNGEIPRRLKDIISAAVDSSAGDRVRATTTVTDTVHALAAAGDTEAQRWEAHATNRGFRGSVDDYLRELRGRIGAVVRRLALTVPAGKSVHRRRDDGSVAQLYLDLRDQKWPEIQLVLDDLRLQTGRTSAAAAVCVRLLKLEKQVGGASTPREALDALGLTVEQWLSQ